MKTNRLAAGKNKVFFFFSGFAEKLISNDMRIWKKKKTPYGHCIIRGCKNIKSPIIFPTLVLFGLPPTHVDHFRHLWIFSDNLIRIYDSRIIPRPPSQTPSNNSRHFDDTQTIHPPIYYRYLKFHDFLFFIFCSP